MRMLAVSALLFLAGPTSAALAGVDLRSVGRVGFAGSDSTRLAVVGDVNGDGRGDFASGLQDDLSNPEATPLDEVAVVAFGGGPADPRRAGFAGWTLSHLNEPALDDDRGRVSFGYSVGGGVAGVGDWDGDGLADVAVGSAGASAHRRPSAGAVYVVLGRAASGPIDVRSAPGVIRIDGPKRAAQTGRILAPAGDVDGDGRPDLVVALPGEEAVVVRGGLPAGTTIDLAAPPAGTTIAIRGLDGGKPLSPPSFRERGEEPEAVAFAPAGDLDGDGHGELLAGVPAQDPLRGRGRVFVLRGAPAGATIAAQGALARIVGPAHQPGFGATLATVPDSDGDGRPEWLIGAATPSGTLQVSDDGEQLPGGAYVVFSRARGEIRPRRDGHPVVNVDTGGLGPDAGSGVVGVPDRTGDGVPDLLIGLPDASPGCRAAAGAIALVPGRATPGTARVGRTSPRVDGPYVGAELGAAIAASPNELFLGTVPFDNSARLDLWRTGLDAFTTPSPALPAPEDCLQVTIQRRTRAQLLRDPVLRVRVRSNAGDDRPHRLKLELAVVDRRRVAEGPRSTLRLTGTGTRRLTLRLPRRALTLLRASGPVGVSVGVEQSVGTGIRASRGAYGGDNLSFPR
ncbi:VCBS repeat-containing protein [Solirubrobacter taibaiensis]|nr:VCBS repeat-containing protein [Solirubrobacter taibaiensis]